MRARTSLLPLFVAVTLAGAAPGLGSLVGCRGPATGEPVADSAKITSGDAQGSRAALASVAISAGSDE